MADGLPAHGTFGDVPAAIRIPSDGRPAALPRGEVRDAAAGRETQRAPELREQGEADDEGVGFCAGEPDGGSAVFVRVGVDVRAALGLDRPGGLSYFWP